MRRARKERQNPTSSGGRDRWADEDGRDGENSNTRHAFNSLGNPNGFQSTAAPAAAVYSKVGSNASSGGAEMLSGNHYLDAAGNIDYLRVMSKGGDGGRSSAAGGVGRSQNEPRVFHTYGGGKRREGLLPSRASLGVSSRLDAATAPWKKMLELDAEEKKQVDAAMAASQEEAGKWGAALENSDLARAMRLSQEEPSPTMMMLSPPGGLEEAQREVLGAAAGNGGGVSGGGGYGGIGFGGSGEDDQECVWACSACTFHNKQDSTICEICSAPRPLPPPLPPLAAASRLPSTAAISATTAAMTVTPGSIDSGGGGGGASRGNGGFVGEGGGRQIFDDPDVHRSKLGLAVTADGDEARCELEKAGASGTYRSLNCNEQEMEREREGPAAVAAAAAVAATATVVTTGDTAAEGPAEDVELPRVVRKGPLRPRYELRGVLHHLGPHAFAGHYVTDVREGGKGGSGGSSSIGGSGRDSGGGSGSGSGCSAGGGSSVVDMSRKNASDEGVIADGEGERAEGRGGAYQTGAGRGEGGEGGEGAGAGAGAGGRVVSDGWKRYDDSLVVPVSEAAALHGAARQTCYICFYSLVPE